MTRRALPPSAYVSRCCHAPLVKHPAGWQCTECNLPGVRRVSKAWLDKQRASAAAALDAPVEVYPVRLTKEQALAVLYGGYDD